MRSLVAAQRKAQEQRRCEQTVFAAAETAAETAASPVSAGARSAEVLDCTGTQSQVVPAHVHSTIGWRALGWGPGRAVATQ